MLLLLFCLYLISSVLTAEFTLPGECPNVKLQENLDYTKFSGLWYNVASYASDGRPIYDCATLDFQEDNLGYTLREKYVDLDQGNRTQKSYFARVDPTFDAGNKAQFIVSHEDGDKVLQFPFFILSTDYDGYAIAYTCKTLKKKQRTHYGIYGHLFMVKYHGTVIPQTPWNYGSMMPEHRDAQRKLITIFTWVLARSKDKLQGDVLKKVEDSLSKYSELAEHRQSFVLKEFSEQNCAYTSKFETDFFTSNFW